MTAHRARIITTNDYALFVMERLLLVSFLVGCSGSIGEDPPIADDAALEDVAIDSVVVDDTTAAEETSPEETTPGETSVDAPPVACTKIREKCTSAAQCCDGIACMATPLPGVSPTDLRCCVAETKTCAIDDDCCAYLLCQGGKCSRRAPGGLCGADSDCTTNKCTGGRCFDPTSVTGYRLPFKCGFVAKVSQGNSDSKCGAHSHTGVSGYAYDFGVALNTPVYAMRAGTVTHVKNDIKPGNPCYSGGGSSCINSANYVTVKHDDGFATTYVHLNDAVVKVGQAVTQGQQVGLSGGTGWSTGPHMHVQKQNLCGSFYCQSVPLLLDENPGARLDCGMTLTSKNGC